jgi:hypothetical protein
VDILTPGTYRILTQSVPLRVALRSNWPVRRAPLHATVINENQIGLVEAPTARL